MFRTLAVRLSRTILSCHDSSQARQLLALRRSFMKGCARLRWPTSSVIQRLAPERLCKIPLCPDTMPLSNLYTCRHAIRKNCHSIHCSTHFQVPAFNAAPPSLRGNGSGHRGPVAQPPGSRSLRHLLRRRGRVQPRNPPDGAAGLVPCGFGHQLGWLGG